MAHVPTVAGARPQGVSRTCAELAAGAPRRREPPGDLQRPAGPRIPSRPGTRVWAGFPAPCSGGFLRIIDDIDPDIVHLHGGSIAPALAFAPALRGRTVVATSLSGVALPDRGQLRVGRLVEHLRSNATLTRGAAGAAGGVAIARFALRTGRVTVLCTPTRGGEVLRDSGPVVRVSGGATIASTQARWSDDPVVVFAGRAERARGIDDLITAFARVHREVPRARLRLVLLPGPEGERWATELGGAPWADVSTHAVTDLQTELAKCQVAAFPFRWSATVTPALAAAEAMATGLPIVATSVSCLAPLVEPGRNGFLVAPSDPDALAAALVDAIRGPERWGPLAEGARKTIEERWSWADPPARPERGRPGARAAEAR